jgi:predicted O-methyltransferase YrrM
VDQQRFDDVDRYLDALFVADDPVLDATLRSLADAGMPSISVSPTQGRFLTILTRVSRARRVLEIGTLAGYSTICLARGLSSDGRLVSLEYDARYADVARANVERARLSDVVEIRVGRAIDTLPALADEPPFDLIFIDADKASYPEYLEWSVRLSRPGTLIVADNVVRDGEVLNPDSSDENIRELRRFNELVASDERLEATALQVAGAKGLDGIAFAVVR